MRFSRKGLGAPLRSLYSANTLNQYTSREVPNALDVLGASHATNSVTVNGSAADYRRGEYFQELVGVNRRREVILPEVRL